ncbi:MAG: vitamin K epoxide reductase family protein [Patescibacteria group bacterium]
MINSKTLSRLLLGLSLLGFVDAAYLTVSHYQNAIPPCTISGCETVLTSEYAVMFGVPLALLGALYYLTVFFLVLSNSVRVVVWLVGIGFVISLVLVGLQLFVLDAICQYCMISAATTTLLLIFSLLLLRSDNVEPIS